MHPASNYTPGNYADGVFIWKGKRKKEKKKVRHEMASMKVIKGRRGGIFIPVSFCQSSATEVVARRSGDLDRLLYNTGRESWASFKPPSSSSAFVRSRSLLIEKLFGNPPSPPPPGSLSTKLFELKKLMMATSRCC